MECGVVVGEREVGVGASRGRDGHVDVDVDVGDGDCQLQPIPREGSVPNLGGAPPASSTADERTRVSLKTRKRYFIP